MYFVLLVSWESRGVGQKKKCYMDKPSAPCILRIQYDVTQNCTLREESKPITTSKITGLFR